MYRTLLIAFLTCISASATLSSADYKRLMSIHPGSPLFSSEAFDEDAKMCGYYDSGCITSGTDMSAQISALYRGVERQTPNSMSLSSSMFMGTSCADDTLAMRMRIETTLTTVPSDASYPLNTTITSIHATVAGIMISVLNCTPSIQPNVEFDIRDVICYDQDHTDIFAEAKENIGKSNVTNYFFNTTYTGFTIDVDSYFIPRTSDQGCSSSPTTLPPTTLPPTTLPPTTLPPTTLPPTTLPPTTLPPTTLPPTTLPPTTLPPTTLPPTLPPTESPTKKPINMLLVYIGAGAVIVIVLVIIICCCCCKKGRNDNKRVKRAGYANFENNRVKKNYV